jgi:hypothetical protein
MKLIRHEWGIIGLFFWGVNLKDNRQKSARKREEDISRESEAGNQKLEIGPSTGSGSRDRLENGNVESEVCPAG